MTTLLALISCDEPPDIPAQPYRLISATTTPATALDVDAEGHYVAVAASAYGGVVYDVSNLAHPVQIYRDTVDISASCRRVAIETVHNYIYTDADATQTDSYFLMNFIDGSRPWQGDFNFSSNVDEVQMVATADSVIVFRTDYSPGDGLQSSLICRTSDTTWDGTACPWWDQQWSPLRPRVRGFGLSPDQQYAAVAVDDQGIHLNRVNPFESLGDTITTGVAYDCAWSGNYVYVADRYRISVVDASDPHHPFVVTSIAITGADRMARVVIDGNYAFFLDELDGIYVVDISNPLQPRHIQTLSLQEPTSLDAFDGKLFVTDAVQGLVIYSR
jgi:hypothetical protein